MINRTCSKCGKEFMGYADDCGCQGNIPIVVNSNQSKTMETSWFKKHLNLTWLFWLIGLCFFVSALETFLGFDFLKKGNNSTYFLCWAMLPVNGWVLYQKGRSGWWLLLALFFPFISIILTNKKVAKAQEQLTNSSEMTKKENKP